MTTATTTDPADAIRDQVHAMWGSVAAGWADQSDYVAQRGAAVTAAMLTAVGLTTGERVLELACGTGDVGIAAARRVGATGHVVITDVAPEMVAVAARQADSAGLGNVSTAVRDIEQIAEPDAGYDVVLCRDGLMFAVDPQRGAAEIRRVLRPGGRTAVVVWQVPPPGIPGPFALGDAGRLPQLLDSAGLVDISLGEIAVPVRAPDFDTWFTRVSMLAGPLARIVGSLSREVKTGLLDRLRDSVTPYATAEGIELPGIAWLATGRAPE
jgi:SAM-dependent methyltransferase